MIGCSAAANAIEISDLLIIYIVKKFFLNRYLSIGSIKAILPETRMY
jgi:hypothetical protein